MRLHNYPILLLLLTLYTGRALAELELLRMNQISGILDKAATVRSGPLDEATARELAREFLSEQFGKYQLLRLTIGTSGDEVIRSLAHGSLHDARIYDRTVEVLGMKGLPSGSIARIIATRVGVLFSYASGTQVSEKVLRGQDPTQYAALGVQYRLLHFVVSGEGNQGALHVYMKASRVSVTSCTRIVRQLATEFSVNNITVSVRKDSWFLGSSNYPDVYRFEANPVLPNELEGKYGPSLTCGLSAGAISCSGNRFEP